MFLEVVFYLAFTRGPEPDLYPHLPPIADAQRFPGPDVALEQKSRCREHLERLQGLELAWPERREDIRQWQQQTHEHIWYWDALIDVAASAVYVEESARIALWRLRRIAGEARYQAGWTPPLVPVAMWPEPEPIIVE